MQEKKCLGQIVQKAAKLWICKCYLKTKVSQMRDYWTKVFFKESKEWRTAFVWLGMDLASLKNDSKIFERKLFFFLYLPINFLQRQLSSRFVFFSISKNPSYEIQFYFIRFNYIKDKNEWNFLSEKKSWKYFLPDEINCWTKISIRRLLN